MRNLLLHHEEQFEASLEYAKSAPSRIRKEFTKIALSGFPLVLLGSIAIFFFDNPIIDLMLTVPTVGMIWNIWNCEKDIQKLSAGWKENEELVRGYLSETRKMLKEHQY